MREAPSIKIINALLDQGAEIVATDPVAISNAQKILGNKISYVQDISDALTGVDAAAIVTEWKQYKVLTAADFMDRMNVPILVDGRKIYDPKAMLAAGVKFYQIGYSENKDFVPS
jgi:UDPglucose 6-dehydrogenase